MIPRPSFANGFAPRDGQAIWPELWRGCVGAWNPGLGPTGLRLFDSSPYKNHGTLTNMVAGDDWVRNQGRHAIDLDGGDDWVDVGRPSFYGALPRVSFSMWIRANANPAAFDSIGGCTTVNDAWNQGYGFYFNSSSVLRFFVSVWNVSFASSVATTFTNLTHVCGTWDGNNANIFVNGARGTSSGTVSSYGATVYGVTIGKITTANNSYNFNGSIFDVAIHSRALAENEIRLLATRPGIAYELAPRRWSAAMIESYRRRVQQSSELVGGGLL